MIVDEITSLANIEQAYLEVVDRFISDRKNWRYHGLDGYFLRDHEITSHQLLVDCQKELLSGQPIEPALSIKIPKKNKPNSYREIFIYNIRERIKAQAIYRVILPQLDSCFSERLFSYRPGRPPHLAAKQFCRNYRQVFSKDQALILDLKNYSEQINYDILIGRLERIFADQRIIGLLRLFIGNSIYRQGVIEKPTKGLVQGVPLVALFANLYLSDIDFKYQRQVNFYVRVGDDIAILDNQSDRLAAVRNNLLGDLLALGLLFNEDKIYFGPADGSFNFLGYQFINGRIGLEPFFIKKIVTDWKNILAWQDWDRRLKQDLIRKRMTTLTSNYNYQFNRLLATKPQINDYQQARYLSEEFFKVMVRFLYGSYTPRYRRLAVDQLRQLGIKSPYQIYWHFHHGKS